MADWCMVILGGMYGYAQQRTHAGSAAAIPCAQEPAYHRFLAMNLQISTTSLVLPYLSTAMKRLLR